MSELFNVTGDVCFPPNIPNTANVTFVNEDRREVLILETGCPFDLNMERAFFDKMATYQPLA